MIRKLFKSVLIALSVASFFCSVPVIGQTPEELLAPTEERPILVNPEYWISGIRIFSYFGEGGDVARNLRDWIDCPKELYRSWQTASRNIAGLYAASLFERDNPKVKLVWYEYAGEAAGKEWSKVLMSALAAGEGPSAYDANVFGGVATAISKGLCGDITEYVKNWDQTKYLDMKFWAPAWKNGRCYAIPGQAMSYELSFFRKDWFEEAGIFAAEGIAGPPVDWTFDDFVNIGQKLTDPKKKRWAFGLPVDVIRTGWLQNFGGFMVKPDPTGKYTFRSGLDLPTTKEFLKFYRDLKFKYNIALTGTEETGTAAAYDFWGERTAMHIFEGTRHALLWGRIDRHMFGDKSWLDTVGIIPFPKGPTGLQIGTPKPWWRFITINPVISKERKDATWKFLNFILVGDGKKILAQDMAYALNDLPTNDIAPNPYHPRYLDDPNFASRSWKETIPGEQYREIFNYVESLPVNPIPDFFAMPIMEETALQEKHRILLSTLLTNPNADLDAEVDKVANMINKTVLNYKIEGQTWDNIKEWATSLKEFYEKNFPEQAKVFNEIYETSFAVWPKK